MTTTPDLGLPLVAGQQSQPEVTHNEALILLQAMLNGAITIGDNAPPGSPAEGDVYVVGGSPTGLWAGRANVLAIYYGAAWRFLPGDTSAGTPIAIGARNAGLRIWVRGAGDYVWTGAAWVLQSATARPYDFGTPYISGQPTADEVIASIPIVRAITIPADFAGSVGYAPAANPAATFDIDVQDDGASIGTVSISTGGSYTFTTVSGTAKAVAAGSLITLVAPTTPDASIDGIQIGFAATET